MKTLIWLVRRELWQYRAGVLLLPLGLGAGLVVGAIFGHVSVNLDTPDGVVTAGRALLPNQPLNFLVLLAIAATFYAMMTLYLSWYLTDCLYADRKDRSVLFWKSMPVGDGATVLLKLAMAVLVIPVLYFLAADVTGLLFELVFSLKSMPPSRLGPWNAEVWLHFHYLWLYILFTSAIWFLPFTAWIMLMSAWARGAVALWCLVPPIGLILAEHLLLGTDRVWSWLRDRLWDGYLEAAFRSSTAVQVETYHDLKLGLQALATPGELTAGFDPRGFLASPQTWAGLAIGIALLYAVLQLRRSAHEV